MGLSEELEKLKFDKRLTEWHMSRGLVTKEEVENYLNSLPDLSENVESFTLGEETPNNQAQAQSQPQAQQASAPVEGQPQSTQQ